MVDKAKELIPDFIAKNISAPLSKAEKAIERARTKVMAKAGTLDTADIKKTFDEVRRQLQKARAEVENLVNEGMGRTMQALNMPTRDELETIRADVAKLAKDVSALKTPKKPAAKKAPAKAAPKKAAPKKAAAKKTAKKTKK